MSVANYFTGKERDAESGLDYFGARYYASSMGRWMSPDWADKPEAVPYSSLDNPQSLNLYEYVGNNPLSKADADGHQDDDPVDSDNLKNEVIREENALRPIEGVAPLKPLSLGPNGAPLNLTEIEAPAEYQREQNELKPAIDAAQAQAQGEKNGGRSGNDVKPDPNASGAHSVMKKDANGNTTGYTTFNDKDGATKRVDITGKAHGGVETPHVHEPIPGKGPGAPLRQVRPAQPDELPH